ncbi:MAG: tetratricopeptide (TPR) repeat protein [Thermoproteota archaeon]
MLSREETSKLNQAQNFFKKRDYKSSLSLLNEIVEVKADSAEVFFTMGNIFHMKGEIGKAIKAFTKVTELDPEHTEAAISLSVLYNDIGKYEKAQEIFTKVSSRVKNCDDTPQDSHINKKFAVQHFELAELYASYNRYDEAIFEYNKAISLDPNHLEVRIKVAKVFSKKGYKARALDELRKLKSEFPDYVPARIALGLLHYGNGDVLSAQTEWQNVLSKDPKHEEALMYFNLSSNSTETSL